jgi:hypothetical protein
MMKNSYIFHQKPTDFGWVFFKQKPRNVDIQAVAGK